MTAPATFAPFAGLSDADFDRAINATFRATVPDIAPEHVMCDCPDAPTVGMRVRIRRNMLGGSGVDLRGALGTVTTSEADEISGLIAVTLDVPLTPGTSETTLYWTTEHGSFAPDAYAVVPFWKDCALVVDLGSGLVPEVCR